MKNTYEVTVVIAVPDNFDDEGIKINVEESLNEHPDFENVEVIKIEDIS